MNSSQQEDLINVMEALNVRRMMSHALQVNG
jgi:hypothetical protein